MGIIKKHSNLYTKKGKLICKAGCYPKGIITVNTQSNMLSITYNPGMLHPMHLRKV